MQVKARENDFNIRLLPYPTPTPPTPPFQPNRWADVECIWKHLNFALAAATIQHCCREC